MSELKQVEIPLDDMYTADQKSSQEWVESVKGQIQISDEEAKIKKKTESTWFKLEETEQIIYIPLKTSEGLPNTGKTSYKAYIAEYEKKNVVHDTLEEFNNDSIYQNRKDKTQKPRLRHEVEVILLASDGSATKTQKKWDMADTAYRHIFVEFLTPKNRVIRVKKPIKQTDPPITKYVSKDDLAELGFK